MKSILHDKDDGCFVCGNPYVEEHHVFFGPANRKLSEKYGMKIYLCAEHHRGARGVHCNRALDLRLKRLAQKVFEDTFDMDFIAMFGQSYLGVTHEDNRHTGDGQP